MTALEDVSPGPCCRCGKSTNADGSEVLWRCRTCNQRVCRECTLVIPGGVPREYYEETWCSEECRLTARAEVHMVGGLPLSEESMQDHLPDHQLLCGRCYDEVSSREALFDSKCDEKPESLLGAPIGMYHCHDCGAMLLGGLPHPKVCARCRDRRHPGFDEEETG